MVNEADKKFLESLMNEIRDFEEVELRDLSVKLNGVVLRKAEFDGDFNRVYSKIFKRIAELEAIGSKDVIDILGDKGG